MRADHDQALIDEFQRRGIDTSAVYNGKAISFAHPVRYELPDSKLLQYRIGIEWNLVRRVIS